MTPLQRARLAFRAARHQLAAAVLSDDDAELARACWTLLQARDALVAALDNPDDPRRREVRALRRWRRFALALLREDPPPPGLLDRARLLSPPLAADGGDHMEDA